MTQGARKFDRDTILLAEDDPKTAESVEAVLSRDFSILRAATGREALGIVNTARPWLVILSEYLNGERHRAARDLMPLRSEDGLPRVLLLRRPSRFGEEMLPYRLDVDMYLTTPFNPTELRVFVERLYQCAF